jgi:CRISPR-associated exonuclease Cas4
MQITGTHFNYYLLCQRKLWLFANGINMEQTSDLVYEGKLIHENSYPQRSERMEEIEIDGIKIDYFDVRRKVIHEIKKSDKIDEAHVWQLKYYIYVLEQNQISGVTGLLEYPKLRKTEEVLLTDDDRKRIVDMKEQIAQLIESDKCPETINKPRCKNCSYYDFCYADG